MAWLRSSSLIFLVLAGIGNGAQAASAAPMQLAKVDERSQIPAIKALEIPTLISQLPPAKKPAKPLPVKSMKLGGMTLQFIEAQVRQVLGAPSSVRESDNPSLGGKERYLSYFKNGIQGVQLIQSAKTGQYQVFSILAIDSAASTSDGIKPGDPVDKLIKTYGTPSFVENVGNVDTLSYISEDGTPAELAFTVLLDTNRITEVRLSRRANLAGQSPEIPPQVSPPAQRPKQTR
jgi:hypothetical protein